jgi:hypothetical protein
VLPSSDMMRGAAQNAGRARRSVKLENSSQPQRRAIVRTHSQHAGAT